MRRLDSVIVFILIILWVSAALLVSTSGASPVNDDWAYAWSVKQLLATGELRLSDWDASNLIPQILWGALFCLPYGFSFDALRISSLVLGLIGVLATYGLFRQLNVSPKASGLGALLLAFNPIYFALSNTFMNDVPGVAIATSALFFLCRGLIRDSLVSYVAGFALAALAIWTRQSSIIMLFGFGVISWVKWGPSWRALLWGFTPFILGSFINYGFSFWLESTGLKPLMFGNQLIKIREVIAAGIPVLIENYLTNLPRLLTYLGLFSLMLLIRPAYTLFRSPVWSCRASTYGVVLLGIAMGMLLIVNGQQLPSMGNHMEVYGMGPVTIPGRYHMFVPEARQWVDFGWDLITIIAAIGAIALIAGLLFFGLQMLRTFPKPPGPKRIGFVIMTSACVFYLLVIGCLPQAHIYDRYVLMCLPMVLVLASIMGPRVSSSGNGVWVPSILSGLLMLGLMFYSITSVHDFLSIHRLRWQLVQELIYYKNVPPNQINGGFAINGWFFGNEMKTCNPEFRPSNNPPENSDFVCLAGIPANDTPGGFRFSLVPMEGYRVAKTSEYQAWSYPWTSQRVLLLQKI